MVKLHRFGLQVLTNLCSQPYSSPAIVDYLIPNNLRLACARLSTMASPPKPIAAPFGTWKSPLESETVYQKSSSITGVLVDVKSGRVFHIESRPSEAGRSVLLDTLLPDKQAQGPIVTDPVPVVPSSSNVRTRVHEYGEGAARVNGGYAYWSEFQDGRIYRRQLGADVGLEDVEALTPASDVYRYADFDIHPTMADLLICIREDHTQDLPSKVKNSLVLINTATKDIQEMRPARADGFYAFPRFGGKDGSKIAWIEVSEV
ncbi:hypothetical protein QFC19_006694 [Naganishia cerealis]|uniref:Uncharacterized protein n=1 Tax=Naganishia cerealis TaxID=610337 RepID=A0ACC2VGT8_9TREE|nr:hypothetical protein QFC19_006694 [Naganishia cerealis]